VKIRGRLLTIPFILTMIREFNENRYEIMQDYAIESKQVQSVKEVR